jgi:4-amino-4-deoxy-L-arabinose transferase-like glycosyltransferase
VLTTQAREELRDRLFVRQDAFHILLLCVTLLVGAALRLYNLGTESFWLDEVTMLTVAGGSLASIVDAAIGGRPPTFVFLAHFWMGLFGASEQATRMLTAVISIASLGLMYFVGRKLFNKEVALLSLVMMAISERQIYHAQNFRYYSLFVLMALLSFLFLHYVVETKRARYFVLYALTSTLLFHTHTFGIFVIAGHNLYVLLQWRTTIRMFWRWVAAQVAILLGIGFFLVYPLVTATSGTSDLEWIPERPLWYPLVTLYRYLFSEEYRPSLTMAAAGAAVLAVGLAAVVLRCGLGAWLRDARALPAEARELAGEWGKPLTLVACWLACPILLPLILSQIVMPMYIDRYTITASPAFYLLLSVGLFVGRKLVPMWLSVLVLVVLVAPGLREYYTTFTKEQWREAAAYVEASSEPADAIIFTPSENGTLTRTFRWYYRGDIPTCNIDLERPGSLPIGEQMAACAAGSERYWVVVRGLSQRVAPYQTFLLGPEHPARVVRQQEFKDITLYLFETSEPRS